MLVDGFGDLFATLSPRHLLLSRARFGLLRASLRAAAFASASLAPFRFAGSSFRVDQSWSHIKSSIRWV